MKNVISTTLYGGDKRYFRGAIYNARLTKQYFPGWEFRVYHEDGIDNRFLQELSEEGANVINVGPTQMIPSAWRFLVYDDEEVNFFISRDLDDRLNSYDAELVKVWIQSGHPFHIIRSNRGHMNEMLAGLWGGKSRYLENFNMMEELQNFFLETRNKEEDQKFLRLVFYPKIRDISVVYGYDFYNSPYVENFPIEFFAEDGHISYPVGEVYEADDEKSLFQ